MADALARLRQIGQVVEDTQGSEDVTDQIVDLDARMNSARATEKRLTELLANRTGKLSDVLEVERELTRVRLDIERLDAEKTNVGRRVSYATIGVTISEERKAGLVGPLSLATRIRIAAADGLESALESVTATVLFILRAGPSLMLWSAAAGFVWLVVRRRVRFGFVGFAMGISERDRKQDQADLGAGLRIHRHPGLRNEQLLVEVDRVAVGHARDEVLGRDVEPLAVDRRSGRGTPSGFSRTFSQSPPRIPAAFLNSAVAIGFS